MPKVICYAGECIHRDYATGECTLETIEIDVVSTPFVEDIPICTKASKEDLI